MSFLVAQYHHSFTVDPIRAAPAMAAVMALALGLAIGKYTARPRLVAGARAFLQMTLFTVLGVVL
ncbi:hypothetical protein AB2C59_33095, partial [Pseudomonas aeruginosa]